MKATQVVSFSAGAGGLGFALEQKPWPKKSARNFAQWMQDQNITPSSSNIFAAHEAYLSQCNDDGDLVTTLRVRLHDLATPYTLRASYGQLGAATLVEEGRQEYLAFELETQKEITFGEITAATWNGDVYDAAGNVVSRPPTPTISGRRVTVPDTLYGVLEVSISERLYEYSLTLSPRTPTPAQAADADAIHAQLYAATAMLFCDNRITIKEIDMPDDFGNCSGGQGGTTFTDDEDDEEEESGVYDVTFEAFNYCTGAAVTGATIRLSYTDNDGAAKSLTATTGTPVRLPSGSYDLRVTAAGYTPSDEDDLSENDSFTLSAPRST